MVETTGVQNFSIVTHFSNELREGSKSVPTRDRLSKRPDEDRFKKPDIIFDGFHAMQPSYVTKERSIPEARLRGGKCRGGTLSKQLRFFFCFL